MIFKKILTRKFLNFVLRDVEDMVWEFFVKVLAPVFFVFFAIFFTFIFTNIFFAIIDRFYVTSRTLPINWKAKLRPLMKVLFLHFYFSNIFVSSF